MKYLLLIYNDPELLDALPAGGFDTMMSACDAQADELKQSGSLVTSQKLQPVQTATTLRVRSGKVSVTDGPFAETKEQLGGFNLIEARDLDEAIRIAQRFPWTRTGAVEIRPVQEPAEAARREAMTERSPRA